MSAIRKDLPPVGCCWIRKTDGTVVPYFPAADTNGARGEAFLAAFAAAVAGEAVELSAATFAISNDLTIDFSVAVCGAGRGRTVIECSGASKITLDAENIELSEIAVVRSGSNTGMVLTCNVTSMATVKDGIVLRDVEVRNDAGMACGTLHGDAYGCRFYGMTAIDWLYGGRLHDCEVQAHDPLLVTTTHGIKTAQSIADFGGAVSYDTDETDRRRRSLVSGGRIVNTDPNGIGINGVAEDPDGDRTTRDWFLAGGVPAVSWYPVPVMGTYILGPQPRAGAGPNNLGVIARAGGTGAALRGTLNVTNCEVYGFYQASYLHDSNITGGIWISEDGDYQVMNNVEACTFLGVHFIYGNNRLGTSDGLRRVSLNSGNAFHQCHFQGETESLFEGYQHMMAHCAEYGFDGLIGPCGWDHNLPLALRLNGASSSLIRTESTADYSLTTASYELWFRCLNVGSDQRLFCFEDTSAGVGAFSANIIPSNHQIYVLAGGVLVCNASGTGCADGDWHHLAVTFTGGAGEVFLDGTSIGTNTGITLGTGPSTFRFGHADGNGFRFTGDLTECRISSVVRYTGSFTPQRKLLADANTVSLWSDSTRKKFGWTDQMGLHDADFVSNSGFDLPFWVLRDRAYAPN